ncbi:hypothetical protein [Nannocystis punicea]|uniref:Tetratricopeptide repeat protein n=1 Tax=Nannocystis punicea TaxID=2995304 RepID=A0ABY7HCC4_9BACT|nr:hypothetical protein [Nannocystis poenicansa]WAS96936.1 hypothetical protein O0S08_12370 [Nannocystis poenicansa]
MSSISLSASGELAWKNLQTHLEWARGFWLGWIFTNHPPSGTELFTRAAELLRGEDRSSELRRPRQPEELATDAVAWLFGDATSVDGCVAVLVDGVDEAWADAWDHFLTRLNLRRDWLRQHLRGGLLLIAPAAFKPRARAAAPDLWSIRSLVFDVSAPPLTRAMAPRPALEHDEEEPVATTELPLALQAIAAAQAAGQPLAETAARLRAAAALLASSRLDEAREQLRLAVQVAPPEARAVALSTLGVIERQVGDVSAAERHFYEALAVDHREKISPRMLHAFASLLKGRGALDQALAVATRMRERARRVAAESAESPQALRVELECLRELSDIQFEMENYTAAAETDDAALALSRQLRGTLGDTSRTLRDEVRCLLGLSSIRLSLGDLPAAVTALETALALLRRVNTIVGDTSEALHDEYVALLLLAQIRSEMGDLDAAERALDQSLALLASLRTVRGTEEQLHDEAEFLDVAGELHRLKGEWAGATEALKRSVALSHRIRALSGDTPTALRNEATRLFELADLHREKEDWPAAATNFESSLDLLRRSRALTGDTRQVVSSMGLCLQSLADVYEHQGQHADAKARLEEAEALLSGAVASTPSPSLVDALAEVRRRLAAGLDSSEPSSAT